MSDNPPLSQQELELKQMAKELVATIDNPVHDTKRYSSIFNLSYDIYRKSNECEPHVDPFLIVYDDYHEDGVDDV